VTGDQSDWFIRFKPFELHWRVQSDINSLRFPMEAVMTEEENRQENWSRLLKWFAVVAVIALFRVHLVLLRVPHGGIE